MRRDVRENPSKGGILKVFSLASPMHFPRGRNGDDLRSNPGETPTVRKISVFFVTLCLAIATAAFAATTPPAPAKPAPTKTTTTTKTTKTHHHHHHHQKPAPAKKG